MMRTICLALAAVLLVTCGRTPEPSSSVVLYSSIDDTYARLASREFEKATGIHVDLVTDSEASKSTGLVHRLIAEKESPVADVFWSGDPMRAARLQSSGVGEIVGSGPSRVRVIVFNPQVIAASEVPRKIEDLSLPAHAARCCIANPLFGTTSMHAATLLKVSGRERAERFFNDFASHGGRVLASNGEVKRRVATGEFALGITDSDDVAVGLGEGKSLDFLVPDQGSADIGAVIVPAVPVLIQRAPHPDHAKKLAQFLSSEFMQRLLAESDAEFLPATAVDLSHLKLKLTDIHAAPTLNAEEVAGFDEWQRAFLEPWVARQLQ